MLTMMRVKHPIPSWNTASPGLIFAYNASAAFSPSLLLKFEIEVKIPHIEAIIHAVMMLFSLVFSNNTTRANQMVIDKRINLNVDHFFVDFKRDMLLSIYNKLQLMHIGMLSIS